MRMVDSTELAIPADEHSISEMYGEHTKPGLQRLLSLLKLDVEYVRARGEYLFYRRDGEETPVIDMLGGYGSTILGHNPAELKAVMKEGLAEDAPVHAQASVRRYSALLARKLNEVIRREAPSPSRARYVVHLANTGTEATEAAVKHALMEWHDKRDRVVYALHRLRSQHSANAGVLEATVARIRGLQPRLLAIHGSFHGKTAGALAVTSNPDYSAMYPRQAVDTHFIARDVDPGQVAGGFVADAVALPPGIPGLPPAFSPVVGAIVELIQGEGGVHPLPAELVRAIAAGCETYHAPLIADEIQTGMYRTGRLLASHAYGIEPDYLMLGKSLGGGLVKIAALLVRAERYQEDFGLLHTSTFAEDDLSSRVALRTLELLDADTGIGMRAERFECQVREGLARIERAFPGVVADVRGKGFLMGVELAPGIAGRSALVTDYLGETGLTTYAYAGYLLHRHGVRVAPTLNAHRTMRLEPCAWISEPSVRRVLEALHDLASKIHGGRLHAITAHLWAGTPDFESPIVSKPRPRAPRVRAGTRKVTFLSHLISMDEGAGLDPMMAAIGSDDRQRLFDHLWPMAPPIVFHEQEIEGAHGERVLLELRGFGAATPAFEDSLRRGDRVALDRVTRGVLDAARSGSTHVGLGQYTSIVTDNGLLVGNRGIHVTTGNSLTIGLSYQALERLLAERGQRLEDLRVGLVGVAGNICNVYAQLVAGEAAGVTLIHREPLEKSPRFQAAVRAVLDHSGISPDRIRPSCSVDDLRECDVVILGTNTSQQMIRPEHLKRNALVVDISVPSNIHPSVFTGRPDVECFQGGYAHLPRGQRITSPIVPAPEGEVFACMTETIVVGLLAYDGHFSYGALNKARVLESLAMARQVGVELGSLKRIASF
jgi:acetylornithine/succinyldiaminopimelate/putrescine aminotransferase/predicted amino acid dehydrogenase